MMVCKVDGTLHILHMKHDAVVMITVRLLILYTSPKYCMAIGVVDSKCPVIVRHQLTSQRCQATYGIPMVTY